MSDMSFWLALYGCNIDLNKVEEILAVRLDNNRINAPEELPEDAGYPYHYAQIAWLLDLAETNKDALIGAGVDFSDSQIWMIYYYYKQCNMEFDAVLMERMGKLGMKLCVSCVEDKNYTE